MWREKRLLNKTLIAKQKLMPTLSLVFRSDRRRFWTLILRPSGSQIDQCRPRSHIGLRRFGVLCFFDRFAEHAPVFRPGEGQS